MTMNQKIMAGILLAIGLLAGFFGGRASVSDELAGLDGDVTELSAQLQLSQGLQDQLAETRAQLETLNVNELYGLVKVGEYSKAYKIGDMNTMPPFIVNDKVGNTPIVVSWCPLCSALTAYDRRVDGTTLTFKVEGARKIAGTEIENLHFRDAQTDSVWAQGPGLAVEGLKKGSELKSIPVQLFNKDVINKMGIEIWKP